MSPLSATSQPVDPEKVLLEKLDARRRGERVQLDFPGVELLGIELRGADLTGANFQGADLGGADLAGAQLSRANLQGVNLVGAILDGADLTAADFRGADLAGCRLDDAVLAGARFEGASLAAVMGDPLSFTGARMDRQTIELSQFTMRDVAQFVVRGVDVNERESIPPSLAPRLRSIPSPASSELAERDSGGTETRQVAPQTSPQASEPPSEERFVLEQGSPKPPLPSDPLSSRALWSEPAPSEPLPLSRPHFDEKPLRGVPLSLPPSSVRFSSVPPPVSSERPSILPAMRNAETTARLELADRSMEMPHSQRVFQNLTALIEAARVEDAPALSLRPAKPKVQELIDQAFAFPAVGETYLGVTVSEELPAGTTSRCFRGQDADQREVVLRIFDPDTDGAALQLPAFQRGLRALSRLQKVDEQQVAVVPLLCVAVDQTAYVVPYLEGQSLKELSKAKLTLDQGLERILTLARAVGSMHSEGVMVRSFKPENILVDGMQLMVAEPDMVHLPTLAQYQGNVGGYAAYAAREEILGEGTRSPTADVFGLGKTLEFLLTGEEPLVPFGSPPLVAQREHVPRVLVDLVTRATAEKPEDRYQAVSDLIADIEAFQKQGDQAVLQGILRPQAPARLVVPALSTGPKLPEIERVVQEQRERVQRATFPSERPPSKQRQVEVGLGIVGGVGGLSILALLILAPRSVESMARIEPFLAAAVALVVFLLPKPTYKPWLLRLGAWGALAYSIAALHPTLLAQWTWKRHLRAGVQVEHSIRQLSRMGARDFSGTKLSGADLSGMDLASANFRGASLENTKFSRAFLSEADFSGAVVDGASFAGANLWGVELTSSVGWDEAVCDRFTTLPRGWRCSKGYLSLDPHAQVQRRATP